VAAFALAAPLIAACGGGESGGAPTLNWYINNVAQEPIAEECVKQADGRYDIKIQLLPTAASGQREQLLRRLAANDKSIDIMSVDPPFMAEFAKAGFLRAFTEEERAEFSEGVLSGPLEQAMFDDKMYSAPWYGNTQLLWYKKSVVQKTGVDPGAGPVTWQQLIDGASKAGVTVAAQGRKNESLMVWVNALVESAGGSILDPGSQDLPAEDVQPTVDSEAGRKAAQIMRDLATSRAVFPGFSTAGEEQSRAAFQEENGGYMVNWPYVWAAFDTAIADGSLPKDFKDDVGWAPYPRVDADRESAPPSGGIGLSVGAFSRNQDLAVEAIRCITSAESEKAYMLSAGDPAARSAVFDDPEIREKFPMADDIRDGMNGAAPRPISPYYGDVTAAIQSGFHPPNAVSPDNTPRKTASLLEGVLTNKQLI
jgi:multiple sugar transport system substrate-binding protein